MQAIVELMQDYHQVLETMMLLLKEMQKSQSTLQGM